MSGCRADYRWVPHPDATNNSFPGVALYRDGQFAEAHEALLEAEGLSSFPDPTDLFFLAMSSWKLGDRAVAHMQAT